MSSGAGAARAAGLPWPDGDPTGVRSAAKQLGAGSSGLRTQSGNVGLKAGSLSAWKGVGAAGFNGAVESQRAAMNSGAGSLERAAAALGKLAVTIEDAQERVGELARKVERAEQAAEEAEAAAALKSLAAAGAQEALDPFGAHPPTALTDAAADTADAANSSTSAAGTAREHANRVRTRAVSEAQELCEDCRRADGAAAGVLNDVAGAAPSGGTVGGPPAAGGRYAGRIAERMTVSDFKELAFYRAGINPHAWKPRDGIDANDAWVRAAYAYYRRLGLEHDEFQWMKLAAIGGPLFYAGFRDIDNAADWAEQGGRIAAPALRDLSEIPGEELEWYEGQFLTIQKAIFSDLAWQHEAFVLGGAAGVVAAASRMPPEDRRDFARTLQAWRDIGTGDPNSVAAGNLELIRREQGPVIQGYYDEMSRRTTGGVVTGVLTDRSDTPIPGSQKYSDYADDGNIANYADRIQWIEQSVWPAHREVLGSPGAAEQLLNRDFDAEADRYRQFEPGELPEKAADEARDLLEELAPPRRPFPISP